MLYPVSVRLPKTMQPGFLNRLPVVPKHLAPRRQQVLVLRKHVLDGEGAGIDLLLAVVLKAVEQIGAGSHRIDIARFQGVAEFDVGRETALLAATIQRHLQALRAARCRGSCRRCWRRSGTGCGSACRRPSAGRCSFRAARWPPRMPSRRSAPCRSWQSYSRSIRGEATSTRVRSRCAALGECGSASLPEAEAHVVARIAPQFAQGRPPPICWAVTAWK